MSVNPSSYSGYQFRLSALSVHHERVDSAGPEPFHCDLRQPDACLWLEWTDPAHLPSSQPET
jgi:hypothetical protein